jgi:aldose 1-epimerase
MKIRWVFNIAFAALLSLPMRGVAAGNYSVSKRVVDGHTTYHLLDARRKMDLGIVPDIGNFAYEFKVSGKDVLIPTASLKAYLEKHWFGSGIPFLAPFANRIDRDYYYFKDRKYLLNDSQSNLIRTPIGNLVLHGLLVFDPRWEVIQSGASDKDGAFIVSHLDFYKYPDLMEQFPFAHTYDITYRLKDGRLECTTKVSNMGNAVMPVHFGYHPYFRPAGPREEWTLGIGAQRHWIVDKVLIPTGETEPTDGFLPGAMNSLLLDKHFIDANFSDFKRDGQSLGHIWTKGKTEKIEVVYEQGFDYAVVYAPLDDTLICIEPQTGPTNAFNMEHAGKFKGLITLDPGKTYQATFWIIPTGFE